MKTIKFKINGRYYTAQKIGDCKEWLGDYHAHLKSADGKKYLLCQARKHFDKNYYLTTTWNLNGRTVRVKRLEINDKKITLEKFQTIKL